MCVVCCGSSDRFGVCCDVQLLGIFLVIVYVTPVFLPVFVPLSFLYWYTQKYFIRTSRELSRLELVARQPIYGHFNETIDGLTSIRAYRVQDRLIRENEAKLDAHLRSYYPLQAYVLGVLSSSSFWSWIGANPYFRMMPGVV